MPLQSEQTSTRQMENHINQSPVIPKWSALLIEAVTKPGLIMKAYRAFHSYSTGNQILALVQCQMRGLQPGPINTFPKWKDLGRFVKRGERALSLCMPITCKRREEDSDEEHTFTSFVYKARWFVPAQYATGPCSLAEVTERACSAGLVSRHLKKPVSKSNIHYLLKAFLHRPF